MGQQPAQVVAVDPFHLHHADAAAIDPVVDVEQVVLLDLGHAGGDLGHAAHRLVVGPLVFVAFGREDLQGHRQRETVGAAPLAEIHHALPARAQQAHQPMVLGPAQTLLVDDLLVAAEQFIGAAGGRMASPGSGCTSFKKGCRRHGLLSAARYKLTNLPPHLTISPAGSSIAIIWPRSARQSHPWYECVKTPTQSLPVRKRCSFAAIESRLDCHALHRAVTARTVRPRADIRRRGWEIPAACRTGSSPAAGRPASGAGCGRTARVMLSIRQLLCPPTCGVMITLGMSHSGLSGGSGSGSVTSITAPARWPLCRAADQVGRDHQRPAGHVDQQRRPASSSPVSPHR